jgi:hypothetical protein
MGIIFILHHQVDSFRWHGFKKLSEMRRRAIPRCVLHGCTIGETKAIAIMKDRIDHVQNCPNESLVPARMPVQLSGEATHRTSRRGIRWKAKNTSF